MDETSLSPPTGEVKTTQITGYVTVTERDSKVLHDRNGRAFIERIMPGAFRRAIERDTDGRIFLDLDHDGKSRASRADGTLDITEDNIGLRVRACVTDEATVALYEEGRLKGWSFTFTNPRCHVTEDAQGMEHRDVHDLELKAVTLVSDKRTPAYTGTQIDRTDGAFAPDTDIEVRFIITDEVQEVDSVQDKASAEANSSARLEITKNIIELIKIKGEYEV